MGYGVSVDLKGVSVQAKGTLADGGSRRRPTAIFAGTITVRGLTADQLRALFGALATAHQTTMELTRR